MQTNKLIIQDFMEYAKSISLTTEKSAKDIGKLLEF